MSSLEEVISLKDSHSHFKSTDSLQVILGTIIGIYKPAAVCFCIATADINNYQLVESWSLAGYLVRNRPIYCWFGFPHAFDGIDTYIRGLQKMFAQPMDCK